MTRVFKIRAIFFAVFLFIFPLAAFSWGSEYHKAIGKESEQYLTHKTKRMLNHYLDGKSVEQVSTWLDKVRKTKQYSYVDTWHAAEVDSTMHYNDNMTIKARKQRAGDCKYMGVVQALNFTAGALKNGGYKSLPDSVVSFYLKSVIHMVEDMHCPGHIKYLPYQRNHIAEYKFFQENQYKVFPFHPCWDSQMIKFIRPSSDLKTISINYTDDDLKRILSGTFESWFNDNASYCSQLFTLTSSKPDLEGEQWTSFADKVRPILDREFTYASLRLANVLNMIFDPAKVTTSSDF